MKIRLLIPTLARPLVISPRTAALCALIVATLLTVPANSPAQASRASLSSGRQQLQGHVPAAVQGLGSTGQLLGSTRLNLAISLPLRNQEALAALIQQLYDPASLQYRHFLSLEQFAAGFGPAEEDYAQVTNFAKAHGLTVTKTYSSRMLVDVSGSAEDIQKAFHLNLNLYRHPTEDRDFYAPDR